MMVGQVSGLIRMVLDFVYPSPGCGQPDHRPAVVAKVHFTYFSALLLVLTALVVVFISLLEKPQRNKSVSLSGFFYTIVKFLKRHSFNTPYIKKTFYYLDWLLIAKNYFSESRVDFLDG